MRALLRASIVALPLLFGGVTGCGLLGEPAPQVDQPKTHSASGISFKYPGNWKLESETQGAPGETATNITVESSGDALALVLVFGAGVEMDAQGTLSTYLEAMTQEIGEMAGGVMTFESGAQQEVPRTIAGQNVSGRRAKVSVNLLGETVPHTVEVFAVAGTEHGVALITQAPDDALAKAKPGFDQILDSLAFDAG